MTEPEVCSKCGQPKPIKIVLRNEKTGEDRLLCRNCSDDWLDSDETWPPKTTKTKAIPPEART